MDKLSYFLTRQVTKAVQDKAARDGSAKTDLREVWPVSIYRWVFLAAALFGALLCVICLFVHQVLIGFLLFLFFAALSAPGLLLMNCRLTYDETGFVWRNMLRLCRRYSYEDVTGVYAGDDRLVVELCGKKKLDFDAGWCGRQEFAQAIRRYRSEKPKKLPAPVAGMSNAEIDRSYKCGALGLALYVKQADLSRFGRFKLLHYTLCTLAVFAMLFAMFLMPVMDSLDPAPGFLLLALPGQLLFLAALWLYFRFPGHFTAREQPAQGELDPADKKRHKRCTLAVTGVMCPLGSGIFFLGCMMHPQKSPWLLLAAAAFSLLLFWGLLALFRRFSWEYREHGVGYVSFGVWSFLFGLSVFFALGGSLMF